MSSSFNISKWALNLRGKPLDVDKAFGPQCHDVWLRYGYDLGMKPGDGHAPGNGYTHHVYLQFGKHRPNLKKIFTKHGGASGIRRGDVIFWGSYSEGGGLPHVAIALDPPKNGRVRVVDQDAGKKVTIRHLSTKGILGVLRPKKKIAPKPKSGGSTNPPKSSGKKTVAQVAKEIFEGKGNWGNDPQRSQKLRKAGYNPAAVQDAVNRLFTKKKDTAKYYTVRGGDTLSGIASKHKTTVANLVRLNGISNPNLIRPNQRLRVK